jgi:hypothetical protein
MSEIVNKVKLSKLVTVDLEKLIADEDIQELDLKDFLFHGMILKEKEFREKMDAHNWEIYKNANLTVYCSTDAIIPKWAYMLVVQHADPYVSGLFFGSKKDAMSQLFKKKVDELDWETYKDKFVLLKGCSKVDIPADIYMYATQKLLPHVKKLMYGEACSNVPVYRKLS